MTQNPKQSKLKRTEMTKQSGTSVIRRCRICFGLRIYKGLRLISLRGETGRRLINVNRIVSNVIARCYQSHRIECNRENAVIQAFLYEGFSFKVTICCICVICRSIIGLWKNGRWLDGCKKVCAWLLFFGFFLSDGLCRGFPGEAGSSEDRLWSRARKYGAGSRETEAFATGG